MDTAWLKGRNAASEREVFRGLGTKQAWDLESSFPYGLSRWRWRDVPEGFRIFSPSSFTWSNASHLKLLVWGPLFQQEDSRPPQPSNFQEVELPCVEKRARGNHREVSLVLCGNLEEWDGGWKGTQQERDICMYTYTWFTSLYNRN